MFAQFTRKSLRSIASRVPWSAFGALIVLAAGNLVLAAEGRGKLSGQVLDPQGQPIPNVTVRFVCEDNPRIAPPELMSSKQGRLSAGFFPVGRFHAEVAGLTVVRLLYLDKTSGAGNIKEEAKDQGDRPQVFVVEDGHNIQLQIVATEGRAEGGGVSSATLATPKPSGAPPELGKAIELYQKGDLQGVLAEADRVLAKNPAIGEAYFMRAVALWRTGAPERAIEPLRKALTLVPNQPGINGVLGTVLIEAGDKAKAARGPADAAPLYQEAVQQLREEVVKSNNSSAALNNLVVALERTGQSDEAVTVLRRLIAADPNNEKARRRLAQGLSDAGRVEEALAELERLQTLNDDVGLDVYNALVMLYNKKQNDVVAKHAQAWILRLPTHGYLHRILGQAYLAQGKLDDAAVELGAFVKLSPQAPEAAGDQEVIDAIRKQQKPPK